MMQAVELEIDHFKCIGTYHKPKNSLKSFKTAVILFNFGNVPRSGHAGFANKICEIFSVDGFGAYRFDFPSLGDSDGNVLPEKLEDFGVYVHHEKQVKYALAILDKIKKDGKYQNFIIGGLCAGFINAVFVAQNHTNIIGIIALEPEFFIFQNEPKSEHTAVEKIQKKITSDWLKIRLISGEMRISKFIPLPKKLMLKLLLNEKIFPEKTNINLVKAWSIVLAKNIPICMIFAKGKIREIYANQINNVLAKSINMGSLKIISIANTNHILTSGEAQFQALQEITKWKNTELANLI